MVVPFRFTFRCELNRCNRGYSNLCHIWRGNSHTLLTMRIAGKAQATEQLSTGDLLIEGWAAVFKGEDREAENFTDGAFQEGIKAFLEGPAPLCFHHKTEKCIGKVLSLQEIPGVGLKMV